MKQNSQTFTECTRIWLKEIHPGWKFNATEGKKLKSIISKIKQELRYSGYEGTLQDEINYFEYLCRHLPQWYQDKNLSIIDSHFDTIVTQISKNTNKQKYVARETERTAARIAADLDQRYGKGNAR